MPEADAPPDEPPEDEPPEAEPPDEPPLLLLAGFGAVLWVWLGVEPHPAAAKDPIRRTPAA
jgi:hypothetical protein